MNENILLAYGQGKRNKTNARIDLKRAELSSTLSENALLNEAELLENNMKMNEKSFNTFGLGRANSKKLIMRERAKYQAKLTESLLVESIFDIFNNALLLDEDFKEKYRGNLYNLTESTFKNMILNKGLTIKDLKKESSAIMIEIIELCEQYAELASNERFPMELNKKVNHTLSENKEDEVLKIDLGIVGDFADDKDFASRNISAIVKNKVIQVIADEQKHAQQQQDFQTEIDDKLTSISDTSEDSQLDEDNSNEEEPNLNPQEETKGQPDNADEVQDKQLKESFIFKNRRKKLQENTLFNALTLSIAKKNTNELANLSENGNIDLDMNLVFAESIAYYTLLETLYTTKLLNVKAGEVRTLITGLLL